MSLLKNILSPFVEFADDKKKEGARENKIKPAENQPVTPNIPAQPPVAAGNDDTANVPPPPPVYTIPPGTNVAVLPEHETYFKNLLEDANAKNPLFQGTDFKEFVESKDAIEAIADEATRYKTAFSVLKRTGLTKEKLLSTGQEYMNLIGRALNAFQGTYAQQYQKDVRQKEQLIQKKAEEIQSLHERIKALNGEMKKLSQEIDGTKNKLDATRNSFIVAGENKQREIQTELEKIAQYF